MIALFGSFDGICLMYKVSVHFLRLILFVCLGALKYEVVGKLKSGFCLGKCNWFWFTADGCCSGTYISEAFKNVYPFLIILCYVVRKYTNTKQFLGLILRLWFPAIKMYWFFPDCCWLLYCYLCLGSFWKYVHWVFFGPCYGILYYSKMI